MIRYNGKRVAVSTLKHALSEIVDARAYVPDDTLSPTRFNEAWRNKYFERLQNVKIPCRAIGVTKGLIYINKGDMYEVIKELMEAINNGNG